MFDVCRFPWQDVKLTVFDFGGASAVGGFRHSTRDAVRPFLRIVTSADRAGQEEFRRQVWPSYYDQADALVRSNLRVLPRAAVGADTSPLPQIWVVDSTDKVHLQTCRDEMLGMLGAPQRGLRLRSATRTTTLATHCLPPLRPEALHARP